MYLHFAYTVAKSYFYKVRSAAPPFPIPLLLLLVRAMLTLPRKQQFSPIAEAREASDAAAPPPRVISAATPLSVDAAGGGGGGGEGGGMVPLTPPTGSDRVGGVAIATCCHHLCNWRDYTGQDYLRRLVG